MNEEAVRKGDRFTSLDGMRGLAALGVLAFHMAPLFPGYRFFPHGYLAVDFFFMLSGFVIAHAYGERLKQPGSVMPFMQQRLVRLYPLLLLGTALGIATYVIRLHANSQALTTLDLLAIVLSLFAFPAVWTAPFPINPPIWSLFWEIIVNFLFAATFRFLGSRTLSVATVLLCASLTFTAWFNQDWLHLGTSRHLWWAGFPRAGGLFALGVLLYRLHGKMHVQPKVRLWPGLALLLSMIWAPPSAPQAVLHDICCVLFLFPIVILTAARSTPISPRLSQWAGALSYPLYATHMPLLLLASGILARTIGKTPNDLVAAGLAFSLAASIIAFSALAHLCYDIPIRQSLPRFRTLTTPALRRAAE